MRAVCLIILILCYSTVNAQTVLVDRTLERESLTVGQSQSSGILSPDENWFVFSSTALNRGNLLFSTPSTASSTTPQRLLSPGPSSLAADIATGVRSFVISPDSKYVVFSLVVTPDAFARHITVPISGGERLDVTPSGVAPSVVSVGLSGTLESGGIQWRPCTGSGASSDKWLYRYGTSACNCMAGTCGFLDEIWSNTQSGAAKRVNVPMLLKQSDLCTAKAVRSLAIYNDYIVYSANPGVNGVNDHRNIFVADWEGTSWRVFASTAGFINNSTAPRIFRSQSSSCGGEGRYLAILENSVSQTYKSLSLYDLNTKTLIGGQSINPSLDSMSQCGNVTFSSDETVLFFTCNPSGSLTTTTNLYAYRIGSGAAAVKVNPDYPGSPAAGTLSDMAFAADYICFRQSPLASATTSGIVAWDWKSPGASAKVLYTTPDATTTISGVLGIFDKAGTYNQLPNAGAIKSNSAFIWFLVTNSNETNPWIAQLNGAAASAKAVYTNGASFSLLSGSACGEPTAATTCSTPLSCQASTCSSSSCAGHVIFAAQLNGQSEARYYSAFYDGSNMQVLTPPLTPGYSPTFIRASVNHPFSDPLVPLVYFYATTGDVVSRVTNLYVSRAGNATATAIRTTDPFALGGTINAGFSRDQRWVVYHSNIASLTQYETFLALADGSVSPRKITPQTLPLTSTAAGALRFTSDSMHVVFFVQDNQIPTTAQLNRMYSATTSTSPVVRDLTLNIPGLNSISPAILNGDWKLDCSQTRIVALTNAPETASPSNLFSVGVAGGDTAVLSFDPRSGVAVSADWSLRSGSSRVDFSAPFYSATPDRFWNTAIASFVTPRLAALAIFVMIAFVF